MIEKWDVIFCLGATDVAVEKAGAWLRAQRFTNAIMLVYVVGIEGPTTYDDLQPTIKFIPSPH